MKVAVNTLFLIPGEVGGSETYVCETLRAVAELDAGLALQVVTNRENDAALRERFSAFPQITFHPLALRASNRYARIVAEQTALPALLRRLRPDVLWSPGYTMPAWAPCAQAVSILDMQYRSHPDDLSRLARWTTHALVSMAVRRSDSMLAISAFSRDEIIREAAGRADRIHVTPLGVDPVFARDIGAERRAEVRRRLLPGGAPFLLCVAHSYPHKNLALLVEAFSSACSSIPHQLLLVGKARLGEPALQAALAEVPAGRVHRVAALTRDDLVAVYQAADAFVFPSLYEGFGLPLLEAMAAGLPVLASGAAATREVGGDVCAYADGRSVEAWAEALRSLARMPAEERRQRSASGRSRAASFTWRATADATIAAWRAASQNRLARLSQLS